MTTNYPKMGVEWTTETSCVSKTPQTMGSVQRKFGTTNQPRDGDGSFSMDTRLLLGSPAFTSRQGQWCHFFLFTTASRPALGTTQPPIQWVPGTLSRGIKRTTRLHLVPRLRTHWAIFSLPQYIFKEWCLIKQEILHGVTLSWTQEKLWRFFFHNESATVTDLHRVIRQSTRTGSFGMHRLSDNGSNISSVSVNHWDSNRLQYPFNSLVKN
jgi:hypothetical protein